MTSPRITYGTIARATGFSKMTVSKALRNLPPISIRTRRIIQQAAKRLGYRPNPMVSALMVSLRQKHPPQDTANLIYLDAHRSVTEVRASPTLRRLLQGAATRARDLGFNLVECFIGSASFNEKRLGLMLRAQGGRGVLIGPLARLDQKIPLPWSGFTCAALGHSLRNFPIHRAASHQFHSLNLVLSELKARGYERIGFTSPMTMEKRSGHLWSSAFARHYLSVGQSRRVAMLLPETEDRYPVEFEKWIRRQKPDAIIGYQANLIERIRDAGLEAPRDLAFAALSWDSTRPECAGVRQNLEAVGAAGIDLIANQLNRNERGLPEHPQSVLIAGQWKEGSTVPKRAGTRA